MRRERSARTLEEKRHHAGRRRTTQTDDKLSEAGDVYPTVKLKPNIRIAVCAGALLTAASAGYGLGRFSIPAGGGSQGNGSVRSGTVDASVVQTSISALSPVEGDMSLAGWFGSRATSLEQVTGSRTLEEHVKHLLEVEDEAVRMLGFLRLLEAIKSPEEIKSALDVIGAQRNGRLRMTEQAMLLQKWAQLDAKSAAGYAFNLKDWARFNGLNAVLQQWVKNDPESAIGWAVQNGAAAEGEAGKKNNDEGNWAVATLIGSLSRSSLDRAIQVAAEQPVSRARGRMMDTLISELVSQRGEDAARNALFNLPDDAFRSGMAGKLSERYAQADAPAAAAWATSLPAGDTREHAVAEVVSQWADKDPVAAGTYLQSLGSAPDYDDARQRYAFQVVRKDPEGALSWALAISNPTQRAESVQGLLREWVRRDAPTAQAWAAANGVAITAVGKKKWAFETPKDK